MKFGILAKNEMPTTMVLKLTKQFKYGGHLCFQIGSSYMWWYHSKLGYSFALHSNYGSILYHFRDKARLVENHNFFHTFLHSTPHIGGPRRNIAIPFGMEKLEWCGYSTVKKARRYISRFNRIPACNGQTDRHLATAQSALCI